jgi:large subunit ribosomal protein L5
MATATKKSSVKPAANYQARLKTLYNKELVPKLQKDLKLNNVHEVPRLEKIIVNVGLGKAKDEKRLLDVAGNTLSKITGQQPVHTTAKKSIASFKLREGNKIGLKVTLRDEKMYEFADRVISIVLPRLRDFHGVPVKAFAKQGNYSLGFTDQSSFPELSYEETSTAHGLQMIFVIKALKPEHSRSLLEAFGLPFEKGDR